MLLLGIYPVLLCLMQLSVANGLVALNEVQLGTQIENGVYHRQKGELFCAL